MKIKFRFIILICLLNLVFSASSWAQNFSFVKDIPCPEVGLERVPTKLNVLEKTRDFFDVNQRQYVSRCDYEQGASFYAYWSEDVSSKKELCRLDRRVKMIDIGGYSVIGKDKPFKAGSSRGLNQKNTKKRKKPSKKTKRNKINNPQQYQQSMQNLENLDVGNSFRNQEMLSRALVELSKKQQSKANIQNSSIEVTEKEKFYLDGSQNKSTRDVMEFRMASQTHLARVLITFPKKPSTLNQDYLFWKQKAIEYLQSIEKSAIICRGEIVSEKGPVAQ